MLLTALRGNELKLSLCSKRLVAFYNQLLINSHNNKETLNGKSQ